MLSVSDLEQKRTESIVISKAAAIAAAIKIVLLYFLGALGVSGDSVSDSASAEAIFS